MDLELPRGYKIPGENLNYRRIDDRTLRSSSRAEDRIFSEITPELRERNFPIYSTTYIPRETISSTPLGIAAAIEELKARGLSEEGEVPFYPYPSAAQPIDIVEF